MLARNTDGKPSRWSGVLITFEGIDGSGKTTNLGLIQDWLKDQGYDVLWTEWDDSNVMRKAMKKAKKKHRMTPILFTLMQAASIADRLDDHVLPHLNKGGVVLADRWYYTCLARDVVRGMKRDYVESVFRFAPKADLAVYFDIDPKIALERKLQDEGEEISYYEAGQDIDGAPGDYKDGFLWFQSKVRAEYRRGVAREGLMQIDADQSIDATNELLKNMVGKLLDRKFGARAA